ACWWKDAHRRRKGPLMRALEGELHDDDIPDAEEPVQLAMHVRKRLRIDLDRLAYAGGAVGSAVRDADRHVGKRSVGREAVNPTFDVHLLGQFVRPANDLLVVHGIDLSVRSVETSVAQVASSARRNPAMRSWAACAGSKRPMLLGKTWGMSSHTCTSIRSWESSRSESS